MASSDSRERCSQEASDRYGSVASLVVGVLDDMRQLMVQELKLAKDELLERMISTKRGIFTLGAALLAIGISSVLLMLMLVHLLHSISELPLWGCYAAVGSSLALLGWILLNTAQRQLREVTLTPTKTIETMKETTQWLGKQTESLKT